MLLFLKNKNKTKQKYFLNLYLLILNYNACTLSSNNEFIHLINGSKTNTK